MPLDHRYLPGAVIPPDAQDYANDYVQMNKYCDRFEIMAYDQGTIDLYLNGLRAAPYAPVADPAWVETLVSMAVKGGVAKNKIILGIPTYGYEYRITPTASSTSGYEYKRLWAFNPQYAIDIAAKLGITPTRDSAGELSFAYDAKLLEPPVTTGSESTQTQQQQTATIAQNPPSIISLQQGSGQAGQAGSQVNTNQPFNYFSWSDARSIADKVAQAKNLGLRGVAVFNFDGGDDPKIWEVLK